MASRAQQSYEALLENAAGPFNLTLQLVPNVQVSLIKWIFVCCAPEASNVTGVAASLGTGVVLSIIRGAVPVGTVETNCPSNVPLPVVFVEGHVPLKAAEPSSIQPGGGSQYF